MRPKWCDAATSAKAYFNGDQAIFRQGLRYCELRWSAYNPTGTELQQYMVLVDAPNPVLVAICGFGEQLSRTMDRLSGGGYGKVTLSRHIYSSWPQTLCKSWSSKKWYTIRHQIDENSLCLVLRCADATLIVVRGEVENVTELKIMLNQFTAAQGCLSGTSRARPSLSAWLKMWSRNASQSFDYRWEGFSQTYLGMPLSITKLPMSSLLEWSPNQ